MRKYLFLIGSSLCVSAPAVAQDENVMILTRRIAPEEITVVASGSDQLVENTGQSISVIGADELDAIQSPDLATVLQRLPGAALSRNGSTGGFTGLFVRGASSQQVLVLVDGIRVADVASPGGGTDLGTLSASGLGKVELLRGSNSVVWGSDAIGGVLAVTTRAIDDGLVASAEYGSRGSVNAESGFGMQESSYEFAVTGGYTETDGISSAAGGTEKDGFRQWRGQGRARIGIVENLGVNLAGRYADSRLEFDGYSFSPPYGLIDTPEYSDITEWSARGGLEYVGSDLRLEAAYAFHDLDRANYNPDFGTDPTFAAKGRDQRAELKGLYGDALNGLHVRFGADHAWERFSTTYDARKTAESSSAHVLFGWAGNQGLDFSAGARIDDHSGFGSEWTFGANASWNFSYGWRVRASYGEGFKAPTLYQLYSDYGDDALSPERSKSYDIGIERGGRHDALHLALTLFRRDSRDLIDFASCMGTQCDTRPFGLYQNVGKARAQGFEVELGTRITPNFMAQAAYTFLYAKDRTPDGFNQGNELARRPRHSVSVSVDWTTPLSGLELGADVRMVSGSYDDAGNFTWLDGYALGTLRASLPVTEQIELFGRVENVTDEQYQTVAGYGTAGRSAYVGARARF
ncbi:MAG: TonB-dependent receptor [Novosphingobium sp.]|nr:TonB-dependent receptor [Novosphingobium sp.]